MSEPGRMMLWNRGQLPPEWTVNKLLAKHASISFNPDVANAFFRARQVEAWGRVVKRIVQACAEAGAPAPQLRYDATGLWVEFPFPAWAVEATEGMAPPVTTEVATEVATQVALLRVLTTERSRRDIQQRLGLKNAEHFRKQYLLPALADGLIEMTLPDKPNSRMQKYRLTAAGRARLAAS